MRLSRMCTVLGKSHRWTRARALSRWARALERTQAEKFAQEMQIYEYARLLEVLSSAKQRWELKHVKSRFLEWRRRVRLWRAAEDQVCDAARAHALRILYAALCASSSYFALDNA